MIGPQGVIIISGVKTNGKFYYKLNVNVCHSNKIFNSISNYSCNWRSCQKSFNYK